MSKIIPRWDTILSLYKSVLGVLLSIGRWIVPVSVSRRSLVISAHVCALKGLRTQQPSPWHCNPTVDYFISNTWMDSKIFVCEWANSFLSVSILFRFQFRCRWCKDVGILCDLAATHCHNLLLGRKYLEWTMRQHIPKKKNNMLSSPVHPLSGMEGRCECGFIDLPLDCVF